MHAFNQDPSGQVVEAVSIFKKDNTLKQNSHLSKKNRVRYLLVSQSLRVFVDSVAHERVPVVFRRLLEKLASVSVIQVSGVVDVDIVLDVCVVLAAFLFIDVVVDCGRGVGEVLQLRFEGQVLREVARLCGFEWHHSSFGLGSNPHPLFIVHVVYPPGRDVLCETVRSSLGC